MSLPPAPLPRETVQVAGVDVTFRSLSRSEALHVTTAFRDDPDGAEIYILARGCDIGEDEARAWREVSDPTEAGKVIDGIVFLSKLAKRPPDDEGPSPQP